MNACKCYCCKPGCQRTDVLLDAYYGNAPDDNTVGCPEHVFALVPDCDPDNVFIGPHDCGASVSK